jgi:hypothetical protein
MDKEENGILYLTPSLPPTGGFLSLTKNILFIFIKTLDKDIFI